MYQICDLVCRKFNYQFIKKKTYIGINIFGILYQNQLKIKNMINPDRSVH